MVNIDSLDDVRELAMEHTSISPYMIHRRLRIPRREGEIYLRHLELEGTVGPPGPERSRPVLRHPIPLRVPASANVLKGLLAMVTPSASIDVAIGACLSCRSLFLITPSTERCLTCGGPPSHILPFGLATPVDMTPEPVTPEPTPESPWLSPVPIACPVCACLLELIITDTEILLSPSSVAPLAEEPAVEVPPPAAAGSPPGPSPEPTLDSEVVPPVASEGVASPDATPSSPPVFEEPSPGYGPGPPSTVFEGEE